MKKSSAFSLIELSIVVLVVAVMVAAITQTSRMVKKARLNTARVLTQTSPVVDTANLLIWYETSLETSFDATSQVDATYVPTWYNNNSQIASPSNATQSTDTNKPKFYEDVFNSSIPAVRFDGSNDNMSFSALELVGSPYTIFVVEQKRASVGSTNNGFFGGTSNTTASNLFFGYSTDTIVKFSNYAASPLSYTSSTLAYTTPTPRMHTARFSPASGVGVAYWLNGGSTADATDTSGTTALIAYPGTTLGKTNTDASDKYFNGDLAEIIIFTRALRTEERQLIENYLSKKYNIAIS